MPEPQRQPWLALLVFLSISFSVLVALWPRPPRPVMAPPAAGENTPPTPPEPRASITFILGSDRGTGNQYYTRAAFYYRMDEQDKTEFVIGTCRSLAAVREHLIQHPPRNGRPWGVINLVVHGNEWTGIYVPVLPGGDSQSSAAVLAAAADSGVFTALPDTAVDAQSEIIVHGCAVGQNRELLAQLARLFRAAGSQPVVRGGRFFVLFDGDYYHGDLVRVRRAMADYWYAYYPAGYRPGDIRLARQLAQRYPDAKVNWRDALARTAPRKPGEPFHSTFTIPITWTATMSDTAMPKLATRAGQQAWLAGQPELHAYLANCGMGIDDFTWSFTTDPPPAPAVIATGKTTVVCVLRAMQDTVTSQPLRAPRTDERYFTTVMPSE